MRDEIINKLIGVGLLVYGFLVNPMLSISLCVGFMGVSLLIYIIVANNGNIAKLIVFERESSEDAYKKLESLTLALTGMFISLVIMVYKCLSMIN